MQIRFDKPFVLCYIGDVGNRPWRAKMGTGYSSGWAAEVAMQTAWAYETKFREAVVVKGKKVPIGTSGTVIWAGFGKYGPRVGIKTAAGEVHFTAASNVKFGPKVPYTPKEKVAAPAPAPEHQCEDEGCAWAPGCVGWEAYGPPAFKAKHPEMAEMGF
jgi:hypothetical protein